MGERRKHYKAAIIGVMFNEKYEFEDILLLGISDNPQKSFAIQQREIMRLYEDYGESDEKPHLEYYEGRSSYDEPISIIKYELGYEHIYCLFEEEENDSELSEG